MKLERDIRAAAVVWSVSDVLFLIHFFFLSFFPVVLAYVRAASSLMDKIFFSKKKKNIRAKFTHRHSFAGFWLLGGERRECGVEGGNKWVAALCCPLRQEPADLNVCTSMHGRWRSVDASFGDDLPRSVTEMRASSRV